MVFFFLIHHIEDDGESDSDMEPQDEDFAETRSSRTDRDDTPNQKSEEMLCNMYAETDHQQLAFRRLHDYHTVDADVFKTNMADNKYGDYVVAQRQSSSTLSGGHLQALDFPPSPNFPKHHQAPGLLGQLTAMRGPFSTAHMGQFSFLPKTNNQDGILPTPTIISRPPLICQLPKHILASQV